MIDPLPRRGARVRALHHDELPALLEGCDACPWRGSGDQASSGMAWARAAESVWGCCGVGYFVDEEPVGYLLFCPPLFVPRNCAQAGGLNADAAVTLAFHIVGEPKAAIARQLAQGALARIARGPRHIHALEVRASRVGGDCARPDLQLCLDAGFTVVQNHPLQPRLRLDLTRTVRWTPQLAEFFDRLVGWTRPLPPEPAGRQSPASRAQSQSTGA